MANRLDQRSPDEAQTKHRDPAECRGHVGLPKRAQITAERYRRGVREVPQSHAQLRSAISRAPGSLRDLAGNPGRPGTGWHSSRPPPGHPSTDRRSPPAGIAGHALETAGATCQDRSRTGGAGRTLAVVMAARGYAVAAFRDAGLWRCEPLPPTVLTDLGVLLAALRSQPPEGGPFVIANVDDEFFLIARQYGPRISLLLSDLTAS